MTTLIAFQAVALTLLAVLVVGLLRSHAEIVRTLHRLGAGIGEDATGGAAVGAQPVGLGRTRSRPVPSATASTGVDLAGTTPEGDPVEVPVLDPGADTLVAFLSSSCSTCTEFWRALRQPADELGLPSRTRLVVVTKDPGEEDQARIRQLAPPHHPVVMSSPSWQAYGVPVTPYFLHVDGATGEIVGQGSGHSWAQVVSLLGRAVGDAAVGNGGGARRRVAESEADVDRQLLAAGIAPGDPRLYPDQEADE